MCTVRYCTLLYATVTLCLGVPDADHWSMPIQLPHQRWLRNDRDLPRDEKTVEVGFFGDAKRDFSLQRSDGTMYKVEGVLFRPSDGAALQEVLAAFDTAAKNTPIEQPPHAVPELSRTVAIHENQGTAYLLSHAMAWFESFLAHLCLTLQFGTFLPVKVPEASDAGLIQFLVSAW